MPSAWIWFTLSLAPYTNFYPMLYDHATSKSPVVPLIDGVICSVPQTPSKTSSKQKSVSNVAPNNSSQNP